MFGGPPGDSPCLFQTGSPWQRPQPKRPESPTRNDRLSKVSRDRATPGRAVTTKCLRPGIEPAMSRREAVHGVRFSLQVASTAYAVSLLQLNPDVVLAGVRQGGNQHPDPRSHPRFAGVQVEVPLSIAESKLVPGGGRILRCGIDWCARGGCIAVLDCLKAMDPADH